MNSDLAIVVSSGTLKGVYGQGVLSALEERGAGEAFPDQTGQWALIGLAGCSLLHSCHGAASRATPLQAALPIATKSARVAECSYLGNQLKLWEAILVVRGMKTGDRKKILRRFGHTKSIPI
jgi:hypothetical protein